MTSVQDPRTENHLSILSSSVTSCWPRKWPLCRIIKQKMIYSIYIVLINDVMLTSQMTSVQDPRTENHLSILSSSVTSCWPRKWPLCRILEQQMIYLSILSSSMILCWPRKWLLCRILEQKMIYLYCPHEWHYVNRANDLCAGSSNSKLKRDQEKSNNGLLQKKVCTMYKYLFFSPLYFFFIETGTLHSSGKQGFEIHFIENS